MSSPESSATRAHPAAGPPDALRQAVREAVAADLSPIPAASLGARTLLVVLGSALALAMPGVAMSMMGETACLGDAPIAAAAVVLVLGVTAIVGSFGPVGSLRFGPRTKLFALFVLLAGWLGYLVVIASGPVFAGASHAAALVCATGSIVPGFLAGAIAIWAFRRADPWTPRRTGALVGAAGGSIAAVGLGFGCRSMELGHLLVGHGLVVPLLAVVGALTAGRTLRP